MMNNQNEKSVNSLSSYQPVIISSTDGINWVIIDSNLGDNNTFGQNIIAYNNGSYFYLQSNAGLANKIWKTNNLSSWTRISSNASDMQAVDLPTNNVLHSIIHDGSKFICSSSCWIFSNLDGQKFNLLSTSVDGVNWSAVNVQPTSTDQAANGSHYYAVWSEQSINGGMTNLMFDGTNKYVASGSLKEMYIANNSFVYGSSNKYWKYVSLDGSNWVPVLFEKIISGASCYGNGKFVEIGNDESNQLKVFIITLNNDGTINYTKHPSPFEGTWTGSGRVLSLDYGNGKYVSLMSYEETTGVYVYKLAYSNDAINWAVIDPPPLSSYNGVKFGNGVFIINCLGQFSENSSSYIYSTDGINWTIGNHSDAISYTQSPGYSNNQFLILGYRVLNETPTPTPESTPTPTPESTPTPTPESTPTPTPESTPTPTPTLTSALSITPTPTPTAASFAPCSELIHHYTIEMVVNPTYNPSVVYAKLIDFENLTKDYGLYIYYGNGKSGKGGYLSYNPGGGVGDDLMLSGYNQIVFTRDESQKISVYLNKVKQIEVPDYDQNAVIKNGKIWFCKDDNETNGTENIQYRISKINVYPKSMTQTDILNLSVFHGETVFCIPSTPNPTPTIAPTPTPEVCEFTNIPDTLYLIKRCGIINPSCECVSTPLPESSVTPTPTPTPTPTQTTTLTPTPTQTEAASPSPTPTNSLSAKFVMLSAGNFSNPTDISAVSFDGATWSKNTLSEKGSWTVLSSTFGNGLFVAVRSFNSNVVLTSSDGINWTKTTLPVSSNWSGIDYGNGKFVAISYHDGGKTVVSEDGITWIQGQLPAINLSGWNSIFYGNGIFIVTSLSEDCAISTDGINWTKKSLPTGCVGNWGRGIAYGSGLFVVISSTTTGSNFLATSPDGNIWTTITLPTSAVWTDISYGNSTFVIISRDSDKTLTSNDGLNWVEGAMPSSGRWWGLTYGKDRFVAFQGSGGGGNITAVSFDGINWTQNTHQFTADWTDIVYGGSEQSTITPTPTPTPTETPSPVSVSTPAGTNVGIQATLQDTNIDITFDNVTSSGTTTIQFLTSNPDGYGQLFNITTTSSFSGSVYVGFKMPDNISEIDFNEIIITKELQDGTMQDVTVTSGPFARHYPSRMVYGMGNGFSNWAFASGKTTQDNYSCDKKSWLCLLLKDECTCSRYVCCRPTGAYSLGTLCKIPCPPNTPYRNLVDCSCSSNAATCNVPCAAGICPEGCVCIPGGSTCVAKGSLN